MFLYFPNSLREEYLMSDSKFITYGITFDVGKSVIKPESMGEINRIVQLIPLLRGEQDKRVSGKMSYLCGRNKYSSKPNDMTKQNAIKIFEERNVRTVWDSEREEWYFSIVDVIEVLTDSDRPRKYWSDLKKKLKTEGSQLSEEIGQLKMPSADGKSYKTDVATTKQLFRLIQSIPSPKAEPFKQWMAQVADERLDQMQDPELSIEQAMRDYKQFKGLKKENLRDNMTNKELVLNMLAELSTKEISETRNPDSFGEHMDVARRGGNIAKEARLKLEEETGRPVVTPLNAKDALKLRNTSEDAGEAEEVK